MKQLLLIFMSFNVMGMDVSIEQTEGFVVEFPLRYSSYMVSPTFNKQVDSDFEKYYTHFLKLYGKQIINHSKEEFWAIFAGFYLKYSNSYVDAISGEEAVYNKKIRHLINVALQSASKDLKHSTLAFIYWHLDLLDTAICNSILKLAKSPHADISFIAKSILSECFYDKSVSFKDSIRSDGTIGKDNFPLEKVGKIIKGTPTDVTTTLFEFIFSTRFPNHMRIEKLKK